MSIFSHPVRWLRKATRAWVGQQNTGRVNNWVLLRTIAMETYGNLKKIKIYYSFSPLLGFSRQGFCM